MKRATLRPARKGWAVVCPDHVQLVDAEAQAETYAAQVEKLGACGWPHRIVKCR